VKDTLIRQRFSLNCGGKLLTLDKPIAMGILNVTPDSFYDGGKYLSEKAILEQAEKLLIEGASIIDIGGASSKPSAVEISEKEEMERVLPVIKFILRKFPSTIISIDTFRSNIAKNAIHLGASIVNDISGGNFDKEMFKTIAHLKVPYIMMHIQGTPQTMQINPTYKNVLLNTLQSLGVNDVIIDPGFGFGKTIEQNYEMLNQLEFFNSLNHPILVGFSRKSMINKVLNINSKEALNGTTVLNTISLIKGAKILRVHDVKEAIEAIKLFSKLN
jgi:dihydropteroate synthase